MSEWPHSISPGRYSLQRQFTERKRVAPELAAPTAKERDTSEWQVLHSVARDARNGVVRNDSI